MDSLKNKLTSDRGNTRSDKSPRVSEALITAINDQICLELSSFNIYANMSNFMNYNGLENGAKLFRKYAHEELEHMHIFEDYLLDRNACIEPSIDLNEVDTFTTPLDVIEKSLKHEIAVTDSLKNIANIAIGESDFMTYELILKMLKEQVEEESKFESMLDKISLYKNSDSLNYFIEKELKSKL